MLHDSHYVYCKFLTTVSDWSLAIIYTKTAVEGKLYCHPQRPTNPVSNHLQNSSFVLVFIPLLLVRPWIETHRAEVDTRVSNLPRHLLRATWPRLHATSARWAPSDEHVSESRYLGAKIALDINQQFAFHSSLQEPVFVSVNVKLISERTLILRSRTPPSSSRGASSEEVFQRLSEEQRVESRDFVVKNETQCSICIDDLSTTRENIIELPQCLHMFHQDCLFEWLCRQNSCPLCRRAPHLRSRMGDHDKGKRVEEPGIETKVWKEPWFDQSLKLVHAAEPRIWPVP
ncbi:hypothetical protein Bca101_057774 [Brassica carinata]